MSRGLGDVYKRQHHYGEEAISLFIQPPSINALRKRLEGRGEDSLEIIEQRIERAEFELSFAPKFDQIIINDDLATAQAETLAVIKTFLSK